MKKTIGIITIGALSAFSVMMTDGIAQAETLRIAYSADPVTVDSYRRADAPSSSMNEHIYEGLISVLNQPLLGTSWTWETQLKLVVNLRKGVKFHNGADFTSRDVLYSACRMVYRVDGKRNILSSSLAPVTNVTALGKYKVAFEMQKPYPMLTQKLKWLHMMSASLGQGVPENITFDPKGDCGIKAYASTADIEAVKSAVGTGPFKLVEFNKSSTTKFVRNDEYWGQKSPWSALEITPVINSGARLAGLLAGDYDVIENPTLEDIQVIKGNENFAYTSEPAWMSIIVMMNVGRDQAFGVTAPDGKNPLKDVRVRKAMSMAINRQAITKRLLGGQGTPANQYAPNYIKGAAKLPELKYDPEQAKELLANAGYKDGFTFDFYVPSDRFPHGARVGQALAQYWSRIGLNVNLKSQPWSVFSKGRYGRKFGVWLYGWGHSQGLPHMVAFAYPTPNTKLNLGSANRSFYSNPEIDQWMEKWAVEIDPKKSTEYIVQAHKILIEDMPGIPVYYQHSVWGYRSNLNLKGRPDTRTNAGMITKK